MNDVRYYTDTQVIERVKSLTGRFSYMALECMYDCSGVDFWRAKQDGIVRPALRRALGMERDAPFRYRLALEFDSDGERARMRALLSELGGTRKEQSVKLLEILDGNN